MPALLTTAVGSYPKPDYLMHARNQYRKKEITRAQLEELERQATREWIEFQEQVGLDILVDGEQYRGDMVEYFAEEWNGYAISGLVRSYGNRYYHKPIIVGKVKRKGPTTVAWWKYAQGLTKRPVKGMLTGPYTLMDWSFDEYYGSRRKACLALARVVRAEAFDLARAGAQYIQIDEPAASVVPDEIDLLIEAMGIVTQGLPAKTISHMCYGDFTTIYPRILDLPVDQLDLEMANSNYALLKVFEAHPYTKEIGLGVVDVHNHRLESVDEVKAGIRCALRQIPAEKIFVDPDCGLKTRTLDEAKAKLELVTRATREVKQELGLN
ncbi:MAG: methionine synthase [Chloroflexota bacterium]|nr:methionine synthase [Chloroflexota bacterium]